MKIKKKKDKEIDSNQFWRAKCIICQLTVHVRVPRLIKLTWKWKINYRNERIKNIKHSSAVIDLFCNYLMTKSGNTIRYQVSGYLAGTPNLIWIRFFFHFFFWSIPVLTNGDKIYSAKNIKGDPLVLAGWLGLPSEALIFHIWSVMYILWSPGPWDRVPADHDKRPARLTVARNINYTAL